jgi:hypothetical protein
MELDSFLEKSALSEEKCFTSTKMHHRYLYCVSGLLRYYKINLKPGITIISGKTEVLYHARRWNESLQSIQTNENIS